MYSQLRPLPPSPRARAHTRTHSHTLTHARTDMPHAQNLVVSEHDAMCCGVAYAANSGMGCVQSAKHGRGETSAVSASTV